MSQTGSQEKQLVKNTLLYTVSNFGTKILTFLIVPLYTYYISTEQYGIYDTVISLVNLLTPVVMIAIYEGLLRWLLNAKESVDEIISTGFTIFAVSILGASLLAAVVFLIWRWEYSLLFILLIASSAFQMVMQYTARGAKRNRAFAVSGVVSTGLMLVLNVLLITVFHMGIRGLMISLIAAHMGAGLLLTWNLRDLFSLKRYRFNKGLAKAMMIYSVLLVPNTVSWWVMNASSRLMMTAIIGASATGIYAIACKLPSIVNILHTIFYQAWQEQAVMLYDSEERDAYYTKIFNIYMKLSVSVVAMLIPFSKLFIVWFMSEDYKVGFMYVGVLYISSLFSSFSGFYGIGYISSKDTRRAMETTVIGAVLNLAINAALLYFIGIWAACIAGVVSNLAVWIVRIVQTKRYFTIRLDIKTFFVLIGVCSLLCVLTWFTNTLWTLVLLVLAGIFCLVMNRQMVGSICSGIGKN